MTPLPPTLDEMCAAIWEAGARIPHVRTATWAETVILAADPETHDHDVWLQHYETTIRQATAALALAEKRERVLREALEGLESEARCYYEVADGQCAGNLDFMAIDLRKVLAVAREAMSPEG